MSEIFTAPSWAQSFEGRNIPLYASAPAAMKGNLSPLLFLGGVHGDEPEGIELAKKTLEWLKSVSYQKHPGEKPPWILIPCINPDGAHHRQRTNAQGIDLNRNFPAKDWTSAGEGTRYYSGKHPEESPEVKALVHLIRTAKPQVIIHCHSWQPCIVCTGPIDHPHAKILAQVTGYPLKSDIGYPTPGSLGEYGWSECLTPVICIEEREGEDLRRVWGHFEAAIHQIFLPSLKA
jgi:hypothetical protein